MTRGVPEWVLPYTAGFIDADGCIGIHKGGKQKSGTVRYKMRVIVGNSNKQILEFLRDTFGGNISKRKTKENRKDQYAWEVAALKASSLLRAIYPYLRIKKEQAKLCLQFQGDSSIPMRRATEEETVIREGLIAKLHKLNKVGK